MRVVSVVGARPQFIKAAPICRALRGSHEEILVHSGQHYGREMSDVFFEELGIPKPDHDLAVGSGPHGRQTGEMMALLEELYAELRPDVVLVYGDTNTTLAAGLSAAKAGVPVAHVEAGLRSYDRSMPEEVNRVVVDHLSDVLLCPTRAAVANLAAEGITDGVHLVGDVMLDTARIFAERAGGPELLGRFGFEGGDYYLATVHRPANSDDPARLESIVRGLAALDRTVIWPLHPRTRKNLEASGLWGLVQSSVGIRAVEPLGYGDSIGLLRGSAAVLTDSGGMQKEAYFFGVPCVTLRETTEWVETVESGWNRLVGSDAGAMVAAVRTITRPALKPDVYGDGHAAQAVVDVLESRFDAHRVGV